MQPYTILLVPDRNIAAADFREQGYRVLEACHLAEILDRAARESVDLLVVGSAAEGVDPLECCRRMKANRATEMIPIAVLNGSQVTPQEEMAALEAGSDALLPRNGHQGLLFTRLRALMHRKAAVDRWEPSEAVVFALARVVERRDRQTGGHAERLAFASLALGRGLGLHPTDLLALYRGGYLHDIGKVAVPDAILFKRGSLSFAEWAVMRNHTIKGEEICRPLRSLAAVLPIIRHHHERWDGSGYPDGLRGHEIPLPARILQLADIYDALTSVRPYKPALDPVTALEIMQQEARRGWRDPELMRLFVSLHADIIQHAAVCVADTGPALDAMQHSLHNLERHLACEPVPRLARVAVGD